MRKFLVCLLIICSSLFSNELPKNMNSVDVYSEYKYEYSDNIVLVDFYTLLKYQRSVIKKQFGFRDILLYSLREIADEAKRLGYDSFHMIFISDLKKPDITIDDYLNNFDPAKVNYIYPYEVGRKDSGGFGSVLALGANVAMGAAAVKNINSGNNVSASSNVLSHSVNGVASEKSGLNIFKDIGNSIDNKAEKISFDNNIFYNTIEQPVFFSSDKNYKSNDPRIVKFTVQEIDKYFEQNPFRIKALYTEHKHLITRGLKDE